MPPVVFEPTISAGERPQTYALDRAATGTGPKTDTQNYNFESRRFQLRLYHVFRPERKKSHVFWPQLTIYQRLIPTISISLSFVGCFHISVFFSPLKGTKIKINLFSPYFSTLLPYVFLSYYILTPISSRTAFYSYTFSPLSVSHTGPQISYSFSFFIPHTRDERRRSVFFWKTPRTIKHSDEHNSLQHLEF